MFVEWSSRCHHLWVEAEAGQVGSEGLRRLQDRSGELISWSVNRPFVENERFVSTKRTFLQVSRPGLHAGCAGQVENWTTSTQF